MPRHAVFGGFVSVSGGGWLLFMQGAYRGQRESPTNVKISEICFSQVKKNSYYVYRILQREVAMFSFRLEYTQFKCGKIRHTVE